MKMIREDFALAATFQSENWEIVYDARDKSRHWKGPHFPFFPLSFQRGNRVVWSFGNGWVAANLVNGNYENHEEFKSLQEVFDKEN